MRSNYKKLGPYIREIDVRNGDLRTTYLRGISSIFKEFVKSKANTVGVSFHNYKIVEPRQFAFNPNTARMGDKIPIALNTGEQCIVSSIYPVFEVLDPDELLPEYLMMWFRRPEFDRYARFMSHGSAREIFGWQEMCDVELPVPSIEKQREIVKEYQTVVDRIHLNEQLNQKLEETAQAIYRHWFVDFEFPMSAEYARSIGKPELEGQPYKSSGGILGLEESTGRELPRGWRAKTVGDLVDTQYGFTASAEEKKVGPKLLRITDISGEMIDWGNVPYCTIPEGSVDKYRLRYGDIVVARTGATVGYAKRLHKRHPDAVFASYLVRMVSKEEKYALYLGTTVDSRTYRESIKRSAEGSGQEQGNAPLLRGYEVVIPDDPTLCSYDRFAEQLCESKEICSAVNTRLTSMLDLLLSKVATS